jgi:HNH endonuclease
MTPDQVLRFWSKAAITADTTHCWLWMAATTKGYGTFALASKQVQAHRIAYQITNGPIPDRMLVLHTCDTPACVNPNHLVIGTQSDNIKDMWERGRARGGQGNTQGHPQPTLRKLTMEQVRAIRASDRSISALARQYGVARVAIRKIKRGIHYREG